MTPLFSISLKAFTAFLEGQIDGAYEDGDWKALSELSTAMVSVAGLDEDTTLSICATPGAQ